MAGPEVREPARNPAGVRGGILRRDFLYAAHLALVASFGLGHALAVLQARGVASGAGFASGTFARAGAFAAMALGMPALVGIVVLSVLEWRDAKILLLFALLAAAFVRRGKIDVLDFLYVVVALPLGALWFLHGRRSGTAAVR